MPDLLTHYAFGYFVARPFPKYRVVYYLGIILPDVISRPVYILFPKLEPYTVAMHTPIFLFFLCLLISELFVERWRVFRYVAFGVLSHLLLDFFQRHFFGGYYWLYPFSWANYEIGLYWPQGPLRLAPLWLVLIGGTELYYWTRRKRFNPGRD